MKYLVLIFLGLVVQIMAARFLSNYRTKHRSSPVAVKFEDRMNADPDFEFINKPIYDKYSDSFISFDYDTASQRPAKEARPYESPTYSDTLGGDLDTFDFFDPQDIPAPSGLCDSYNRFDGTKADPSCESAATIKPETNYHLCGVHSSMEGQDNFEE